VIHLSPPPIKANFWRDTTAIRVRTHRRSGLRRGIFSRSMHPCGPNEWTGAGNVRRGPCAAWNVGASQ
jgi:hypothetical protein